MTTPDHLNDPDVPAHVSNDILLRSLDDELSGAETLRVEAHLLQCDECRHRFHELRSFSAGLESAVTSFTPVHSTAARQSLAQALEARQPAAASYAPGATLRRFGWGMALAATLTLGLLLGPQWNRINHHTDLNSSTASSEQSGGTFEVGGETFVALPYSNPDLPMGAPHIVQMQVPVSSLTEAGIIFEPVSNQVSSPDRSVLADVLLGLDGQPLGVHVLSAE